MEQTGLKLVQELAIHGQNPPTRYVLNEEKRPIDASSPPSPIPIIDLSRLSRSDDQDEAAKLLSAAKSWGLVLVTGHEIPCSHLDEVLNVTEEFFHLPVEERLRYSNMKEGKHFQYEGYGNDRVDTEEQILDWCDRLYLLAHPVDKRDLSLWPEVPLSFKEVLEEFTLRSKQLGDRILGVIEKQLNLNEGFFVDLLDETAEIYARFTNYPPCTRPNTVFGVKPHSDGSFVTILLLDKDVGGLQVEKDGEWVDIPFLPNSILVIFGDFMEIISNKMIKSPLHRVLTNAEKERISIVMFYGPGPEKVLEPANELVNEDQQGLYEKVKVKEYAIALFNTFTKGGRTVDLFKIKLED